MERQRREEDAEYNKLLEQEIREWERQQQESEAELEKQKQEQQLEILKREAELKRQKQEVEQKKLIIEKEKFCQQELLRQAREQELQRQKREKELEEEGRQLELEKQRREAEKLERKQKEEEKLERQRREEEEKHRPEELKRKRREWEFKKRQCEKQLEQQRQQWAEEKQKQEEELRKQEMEEALHSQKAKRELIQQKRFLEQLRMEREKELQRQKQEERDLDDIEGINAEFKTFKGDFIGKNVPDHIKALYEVADAIDKGHREATIAGCAGAGLSVAGGVVAISGAVLAPFTGGASLVAIMGVGGSYLGSITRIAGGVKEKLDNTKREKTLDEILSSCQQMLEKFEDDYCQLEQKINELEKRELKDNYRKALERIKNSFFAFGSALMTEISKGTLKSISQLTGRLLSRMFMETVSQEVSHFATAEAAKEVTKRMTKETTSYFSYEAIKEFLTFSGKEVSKTWYQDVARTSAVASGVASAIFLPFDAKDLYKDATHLKEGANSEIAKAIRNAARQLERLIDYLN